MDRHKTWNLLSRFLGVAYIKLALPHLMIGAASFLFAFSAFANPVVDNVAAGQVEINQSNPEHTVVNQGSQKAIINWRSFNIDANQSTHFQQPAGGIVLNRISPNQGASSIYGTLTATGQVILVNPAGVYFGPSAFVNVGGLIATTANITDQNFLSGKYIFSHVPGYSGSVINEGQIIAANNGLIALLSSGVVNNGLIQANLGNVILASGSAFTLTFEGAEFISFTVDQATLSRGVDQHGNELSDGVKNTGVIMANGGHVMVSAKAAAGVLDNAINMGGVAQVQSVGEIGGDIIFSADTDIVNDSVIRLSGLIDASGKMVDELGGKVTVTGKNILIDEGAIIDVSGYRGGGKVLIGGNYQGQGSLPKATAVVMRPTAKIKADAIANGNGGEIILWSNDFTNVSGTLTARGGIAGGNGGLIETSSKHILNIGDVTVDTSAPLGTSGMWLLDPASITISTGGNTNITGATPFLATAANAVLNSTTLTNALALNNVTVQTTNDGFAGTGDITLDSSVGTLTWASGYTLTLNSFNKIFLNANISAPYGGLTLTAANVSQSITSGTSGAPSATGVTATVNVGTFNITSGQWYQAGVSLPAFSATDFRLASGAADPNASGVKFLRAASGTTIQDIYGLQGVATNLTTSFLLGNNIDASGTELWNSGAGFVPIGSSASSFYSGTFNGQQYAIDGLYENSSSLAKMGLFGFVDGSTIQNLILKNTTILSTSTSSVDMGSLVGTNQGALSIVASLDADVRYLGSLTGFLNIGGLVGVNGDAGGTITQSFSTGAVSATFTGGTPNFINMGGLIGATYGNITYSYSTASVAESGSASNLRVGGFVGDVEAGTVQYNYSSGAVSATDGGALIAGFVGRTTGTVANNVWDVGTSGRTSGHHTSSGGITSLFGGCFGNTTCVGNVISNVSSGGALLINQAPVNLALEATYTGTAGWPVGIITSTPSTTANHSSHQWFIFDNTDPDVYASTRPLILNFNTYAINTPQALQLMGATLGASTYNLTSDISLSSVMNNAASEWGTNAGTATGSGFVPIGNGTNEFTGGFNGAGYAIDGLYINNAVSGSYLGLFGFIDASANTLQNVYITNASVTGSNGPTAIGIFAGMSFSGVVSNIYTSGSLAATNAGLVGGIAGIFQSGSLTESYNTASISATNGSDVGGIAGRNTSAAISQVYNTGNIAVTGTAGNNYQIGGVVGDNDGTISHSYNVGNVALTGAADNVDIGGFIGFTSSIISHNYSSGTVSSITGSTSTDIGGFAGQISGPSNAVNNNLWDIATSSRFNGYGQTLNSVQNLYGGCFGNTTCNTTPISNATNAASTPVNLATLAAYTTAGWASGSTITSTATGSATATPPATTWIMFTNPGNPTRPMLVSEWSTTVKSPHQLQLMGAALDADYTLGANIDLASALNNRGEVWNTQSSTLFGAGFVPIGTTSANFTGTFDGMGYTISNPYINITTNTGNSIGIFGNTASGSSIQNVGVLNANMTVAPNTWLSGTSNFNNMGILVGYLGGSLDNAYSTGTVTGTGFGRNGGLVGRSDGTITDSYSHATVNVTTAGAGFLNAGGFVGFVTAGSVARSFSTGNVNITTTTAIANDMHVGGFSGGAFQPISNSYSLGNLIFTANAGHSSGVVRLGGFTGGTLTSTATLTNVFSTGSVTNNVGAAATGGLNANNSGGATISNSFWNVNTSGIGTDGLTTGSAGGTGKSTANMMAEGTFTSWTFDNTTWGILEGKSFPYLRSIYTSTPRAISATSTGGSNATMRLVDDGAIIDTGFTGANGFIYFLKANGVIEDSSSILMYLDGAGVQSNYVTLAAANGGSNAPGTMATDTVTLDTNGGAVSSTTLSTAKGGLSDLDILYTFPVAQQLSLLSGKSLTVSGTNSFSPVSATSLSGGGVLMISSPVVLTTDSDFSIATSTTNEISGNISGSFGLSKGSSGTLILSGTNTYTGATEINNGVLTLNNHNTLGSGGSNSASVYIEDGGTLNFAFSGQTLANTTAIFDIGGTGPSGQGAMIFSGTGVQLNNAFTFNDFTRIGGTGSGTLAGSINTNNFDLEKVDTGTLTLSGANTHTGNTDIQNGILIAANDSALGSTVGNDADAYAWANGGTLEIANGISLNKYIFLTGTGFGGNGALTTNGVATLTAGGGAVVDLYHPSSTTNPSIGGTGTLTINTPIVNTVGPILDLGIIKVGSGTLVLTGTSTYTGTTSANAGILSFNTIASSGNSALGNASSAINVGAGATLRYTGTGHTSSRVINLTGAGAILDASGSGALTLSGGVTGNTFGLVLTGTGSATQSGVIDTTTGTLTKNGAGTWTLSGANSYTGTTSISAGTLSVNSIGDSGTNTALGNSSGAINLGAGATLQYTGSGHTSNRDIVLTGTGGILDSSGSGFLTLSGDVTGNTFGLILSGTSTAILNGAIATTTGGLTKNGSNTWRIGGSNTYSGVTTINAGTLDLTSLGALGNTTGTTIVSGSSLNLGYDGPLTNTAQMTITGSGTTTISGSSGVLPILNNPIVLSGTVNIGSFGTSPTLGGELSGTGNLVKVGSLQLNLNAVNTYTGTTTVSAGFLNLNIANSIANSSAVTVTSPGTLQVLTNNTLNNLSGSGTVSVGSTRVATINQTSDLTFSGAINGTGSITKIGNAVLTLSGSLSNTTTTNINAGTLRLGASNVIADFNPVALGGGTLDMNGNSDTIATLSGTSGSIDLRNGSTLTVTQGSNQVYAGTIVNSAGTGNFVKAGSSSLTLSGTNTYSGNTTLSAGTLILNNNSALGSSATAVNAGTLQVNGGISASNNLTMAGGSLSASGGIGTLGGTITLNSTTSLNTPLATDTLVLNGAINGGNALNTTGLGTTTFAGIIGGGTPIASLTTAGAALLTNINATAITTTGAQTYNNPVSLGNVTALLTSTGNNITFNSLLNGATALTVNANGGTATFAGIVGGSTPLASITSAITTALMAFNTSAITTSGNQTYNSPVSIGTTSTTTSNSGSIAFNSTVNGANAFTVMAKGVGSSVSFIGEVGGTTPLASLTVDPQVVNINSSVTTVGDQDYILTDPGDTILIGGAGVALTSTTGNVNSSMDIDGGNNALTISSGGSGGLISGVISNIGAGGLTLIGINELSGTNTYTTGTTVGNGSTASTLLVAADAALGSGAVTVTNNAVFELIGTVLDIDNSLIMNDGSTLLSNNNGGTNSISGNITLANNATGITVSVLGAESLSLDGVLSGTLTQLDFNLGLGSAAVLTGANTFTGDVSVSGSGGLLVVANSNALGANNSTTTTLNTDTTLAISGNGLTIANDIVFAGNATLLENNNSSANTISGNINLGTGNTILIDAAGTTDQLTLSGVISGTSPNLTFGSASGTNTIVLSGGSANTYTGGTTTVAGNIVRVEKTDAFGTSPVTVASGGQVDINVSGITLANAFTLNGSGVSGGALVDLGSASTNILNGGVTLASGASIGVQNSGQRLTINGAISDGGSSFSLTKLGAGDLFLNNANTYDGGTNINAGSLTVGNSSALGTATATVLSNAALALSGNGLNVTNAVSIAGTGISNTGALIDASAGGNSNTVSGGVTMTAHSSIGVTNSGTTLTLSGVLGGSGFNLAKVGLGTLSLSNTNTYSGTTSVNEGMLSLLSGNAINGTSAASVATGATLNLAGVSVAANVPLSLTGTLAATGTSSYAGSVTLNSGNSISNTGTLTLGGQVTGSGALSKNGAGTLVLSNGTNNYTGVTNIVVGTLQAALNALPATDLTVSLGALLTLTGSNTIGALIGAGDVILGSNTLTTSGASNSIFAGGISGVGNFTKGGSSTLNLTGTNTFTGVTNVTGGVLQLSNANALGTALNSTSGVIVSSGGQVFLNDVTLTPAAIPLTLNGSGVSSTGALRATGTTATWNGDITLGSASSIGSNLTNDVLTINGTINGGFALTLNESGTQSGQVVFGGMVGGTGALASLLANANLRIAGGGVTTTGTQNYANVVRLDADAVLTTTNSLVTFSTAGISTINSDGTPRSLTINSGSGNINMTSAVGATSALNLLSLNSSGTATIGSTVTAASVATSGTGTVLLNNGNITTSGTQTYGMELSLGAATLLNSSSGNGAITFNNLVNGTNTLTINSGSGAVGINAAIGGTTPLTSVSSIGGGTVTLASNVSTSGTQSYTGAVMMGGTSTLTTSDNAITFGSTINGAGALTLNAGTAAIDLSNGTVGGITPLTSFVKLGSGTLTLNGGVITTGAQAYSSPILLSGNSVFTTTDNAITLNSTIDSSGGARDVTISSGTGAINLIGNAGSNSALAALALNSSGVTTLAGTIQAATITTNALGSTTINASTLTTSGAQTFNDAVTLGGTVNVNSSSGNGVVSFNSTIDGTNALLINSGSGAINLTSAVGAGTVLGALSLTSSGTATIGSTVAAASMTTAGAGTTAINGGSITTSGAQTYGMATTLGATTNLNSSSGNGAITFNGTVNGANALTVNSGSGAVGINAAIGGGTPLASFSSAGSGTVTLGANVATTGTQSYTGAVLLGGTTALTTTNNAISFGSTVNGANALTVNAGNAAVNFTNGVVGGIQALTSFTSLGTGTLTFNGGVITTGAQSYATAVLLSGDSVFTTTNNNVSLNSTIDSTGGARNLTINSGAGAINLVGNAGANSALAAIALNSSGVTTLAGNIQSASITTNALGSTTINAATLTTSGAQTFNDAVTLGGTVNVNSSSGNGAVNFNSTIDGTNALSINSGAGAINLTSAIGGGTVLGALSLTSSGTATIGSTVAAASMTTTGAGTTAINGGSITTSGVQTYGMATSLGATTNLNSSSGNGAITFNGAVNGANALTVNSGSGAVGINAAIGGGTPLASFSSAGSGTVTLGANVTTTGTQSYTGAVLLGGSTALTTTDNSISFGSTVNGANALTISTGTAAINFNNGVVGGITPLASFSSLGTGTLTFNGGMITSGAQSYANAILLSGDSAFTTTDNSITFSGAINSSGGARDLTINSGTAAINLIGSAGSGSALDVINLISTGVTTLAGTIQAGSIMLDGLGSTTINAATITTTGAGGQNYEAVTLGGTVNLVSNNNPINFNSTIDGANALTINSGSGAVMLGNVIGGVTPLASLSSIGSGEITVDGNVTTSGAQSYTGGIILAANLAFTSSGNNINFNSTIDGLQAVTVQGAGTATFGGAVGGVIDLTSLTVNMAANINGGGVSTFSNQTYNGNVALGADTVFTSGANTTVAFNNGLSGNNIDVNAGAGTNSLIVNTGNTQNWTISAANDGSLSSPTTITGAFNFTGMSNVTGGSGNDTFALDGGTLAGNIAGAGGTNTLIADNVVNAWVVDGANAGSVTGINGFSGMQNLVGSSLFDNTFTFMPGGAITGSINGGNLANMNTLDFSAYSLVNMTVVSSIFDSTIVDGNGNPIVSYNNINQLTGNPGLANTIFLPDPAVFKTIVVFTDAPTNRFGFINDPLFFNNFNISFAVEPTPPAPPPPPPPPSENVAQIVQQPVTNSTTSMMSASSSLLTLNLGVTQNIETISNDFSLLNQAELSQVGINPYCYQAQISY